MCVGCLAECAGCTVRVCVWRRRGCVYTALCVCVCACPAPTPPPVPLPLQCGGRAGAGGGRAGRMSSCRWRVGERCFVRRAGGRPGWARTRLRSRPGRAARAVRPRVREAGAGSAQERERSRDAAAAAQAGASTCAPPIPSPQLFVLAQPLASVRAHASAREHAPPRARRPDPLREAPRSLAAVSPPPAEGHPPSPHPGASPDGQPRHRACPQQLGSQRRDVRPFPLRSHARRLRGRPTPGSLRVPVPKALWMSWLLSPACTDLYGLS